MTLPTSSGESTTPPTKQLLELKGELDTFLKNQQGLVDDYRQVYQDFKRKWFAQHTDIQTLYTQLKTTHDPGKEPWKDLVSRCICVKKNEVDCLAEAIENRKRRCFGPLEQAVEKATERFAAAKWRLDILLALAAALDAALTTNGNWIKDIQTLPGPEHVTVLYLFWFRLLPAHRALMPSDLGSEYPMPGAGEAPEDICKTEWDEKCEADPWACNAPAAAGSDGYDASRPLPWLVPPDSYEAALNCAWDEYCKAKNELAIAEAAFKATPDDLATKVKEHTAAKAALETDILKCLKTWKPKDPSRADAEPAQEQGGIHIEEIERGPRPIEGVPTSIAAVLGLTERGPLRPCLLPSFGEYVRWFGNVFLPNQFIPHAVAGFFENGGKRLYVSRVAGADSVAAVGVFGDFTARATGPGLWGNRVWLRVLPGRTMDAAGNPTGFRLRLAYWSAADPPNFDPFEPANQNSRPRPQYTEEFDDLSIDPLSSNFFSRRLTDAATSQPVSALASFAPTVPGVAAGLPAATAGDFLANGSDGALPLTVVDYVGELDPHIGRTDRQGIRALELDPFRDVALVYAPFPADDPQNAIAKRLVEHCEEQRFRFAVIDGPNADPIGLQPCNQQTGITDTQYAAFYAPWIVTYDPLSGARVTVPPGGHILGIYARSDSEHGVLKAPANEIVRGALDVAFGVNDAAQSELNLRGVNTIRAFPERGIRVWGARTLSSNGLWKYLSVRRLFIFLERSIYEGTQWVAFEPNDDQLWARVKDTIRLFLRTQHRAGALFGRTEEEAFFITCDRSTMTQDDILNGRLICEIGIAPVRPAEFVIFRVFQHTAESQR